MTKYEWESELKRNIHRLPDEEIARVMEYYGELFEDKFEGGVPEQQIIAEFGNPVDVADKILSEYDGELRGSAVSAATPPPSRQARPQEQYVPPQAAPVPPVQQPQYAPPPQAVPAQPSGGVHAGRLAVFIVLCVLLGGAFVGVAISLWAVVFSIGVTGVACSLSGLVATVPSVIMLFDSVPVGLVQIGVSLIIMAVGILLILLTIQLCIWGVKLTGKMFGWVKRWLTQKKVAL